MLKKLINSERFMSNFLPIIIIFTFVSIGSICAVFEIDPMIVTVSIDCLFGLLGYYLYKKYYYVKKDYVFKFEDIALLIIMFFAVHYIGQMMALTYNKFCHDISFDSYKNFKSNYMAVYIVLSLFIAPIFEEIIFRGLLYQGFRKRHGFMFSALLSSFLFGLSHGTLLHIIVGLSGGIFMCFVYELTGRLKHAIITHIGFNIMVLMGLKVPGFFVQLWIMIPVYILLVGILVYLGHKRFDTRF